MSDETPVESSTEPDQDAEFLEAAMRLAMISGVGPITRMKLIERFGSPRAVLAARPDELRGVPGVGSKLLRSICDADQLDIAGEIAFCRENNISILTDQDPTYPRMLQEIHDPPGVLFVRGALTAADAVSVAIVGSRHATQYGLAQAAKLASGLARAGVTVVSGLARGIDGAAHRAALEAGGRTIAVLASGVANIYPPEHVELANDIAGNGAMIGESPPRFEPIAGAFPQRNRIISGLSQAVIIVEAAQRSGALITARHAYEQGRDVMAVPGRVDSRMSQGCHLLIRDGAALVQTADDVIEGLGPLVEPSLQDDGQSVRHPAELKLNDLEQIVLQAIDVEATLIDTIIQRTELPVHRVLSTVSVLEMKRLVRRVSGTHVARI